MGITCMEERLRTVSGMTNSWTSSSNIAKKNDGCSAFATAWFSMPFGRRTAAFGTPRFADLFDEAGGQEMVPSGGTISFPV